jgi:hypothetical protein
MNKISAVALCLAMVGLSSPSFAQYGGPGYGGRGDGGYGGARARGSFYGSCRRIEQDGPMLHAMCKDRRGDFRPSQINLRRCGGKPISNQNGRLAC